MKLSMKEFTIDRYCMPNHKTDLKIKRAVYILSLILIVGLVLTSIMRTFRYKKKLVKLPSKLLTNKWREDFNSLDQKFWKVADNKALEGSIVDEHQGYFLKKNVWISNGYLILRLTQEEGVVGSNPNGVISKGGEIESLNKYSYGTYQWRMRMSSSSKDPKIAGKTVPGQISAGFNFINDSQTEIDFEVEGQYPDQLEMTTWKNPDTTKFPTADDRIYTFKQIAGLGAEFHTYKYIWEPKRVRYYVNNILVADHKEHIPDAPAHFMANHWGTDNENFGGNATLNAQRYMLIDWVSYTQL